jgi:hypothetical protein
MKILKDLTSYHRESYKLNVRNAITGSMSAADANAVNIKKKFASSLPGIPFYTEIIEELLREDFSKDGPALREAVLKSLQVAEEKPKNVKPAINFKATLLEGIQVIGGVGAILGEVGPKLDENAAILADQKNGFWDKLRKILKQIMKSEAEEVIYDLQYLDPTRGMAVKEKLNFSQFREDMDKKMRILGNLTSGAAAAKLSSMAEEQIIPYLERNIRDVQILHRTLNGLDDFFKSQTPQGDQKIRGIKPELASVKNCIVRANQLRHEYSAQKEEEEQLKRLGVNPAS